jgi:hypothetical protein
VVLTAPATKLESAPRERMASIASGYSKTRDLFRMAGGQSIPVAARFPAEPKPAPKPAAPAAQPQEPPPSGRKAEASIMFSLEELMKAASGNGKPEAAPEDQQLWSMQTQSPLFGTSNDQALLTTPLEPAPGSTSMDSMTVSSRRPSGLRLAPLLIGVVGGCTLILAGAGWWMFRSSPEEARAAQVIEGPGPEQPSAPATAAKPASAPPAAAAVAVAPAPAVDAPSAAADPAPAEPGEPQAALAAATTTPSDKPVAASRAPSSAKKPTPPRATRPVVVTAQFDKNAARDALNTAATKSASCGSGGGAKGKVQLTFANNGKVSNAAITEGPFAGTAAGKCALRHFKAARIPAFSGPPQTVAKSFKIP